MRYLKEGTSSPMPVGTPPQELEGKMIIKTSSNKQREIYLYELNFSR
jgi:hypothetical protein